MDSCGLWTLSLSLFNIQIIALRSKSSTGKIKKIIHYVEDKFEGFIPLIYLIFRKAGDFLCSFLKRWYISPWTELLNFHALANITYIFSLRDFHFMTHFFFRNRVLRNICSSYNIINFKKRDSARYCSLIPPIHITRTMEHHLTDNSINHWWANKHE